MTCPRCNGRRFLCGPAPDLMRLRTAAIVTVGGVPLGRVWHGRTASPCPACMPASVRP